MRGAAILLTVGLLHPQHDQTRLLIVGYILGALGQGMHLAESAGLPQVGPQPVGQCHRDFVRVAPKLLSAIFGQLPYRGLRGVPVAATVPVQVGCGICQTQQGITEQGRRFSRHHAAELDLPIIHSLVRRADARGRAQVNRTGHAPTGRQLAQIRRLAVDLPWQGTGAVHIFFNDRRPVIRQVAGQLPLNIAIINGDAARQN